MDNVPARQADARATGVRNMMRECAGFIAERLRTAITGRGVAKLAISGGSSPKPMFRELAASDVDWNRVQLFWVDERCVPPDHSQSNYAMARKELVEPAAIPAANVHRVRGELRPEDAARRYVEEIRAVFGDVVPAFDVVHLGMGADGHTASLFPGDPAIEDRDRIAVAVYAPNLDSWRVTLLPAVLLAAHCSAILAAGADKAATVKEVREGKYDPMRLPIQLVARNAVDVRWFLDAAALGIETADEGRRS